MPTFQQFTQLSDAISLKLAEKLDYDVLKQLSVLLNKPTAYKGKGRPRKSDYSILQHPHGETFLQLNRY